MKNNTEGQNVKNSIVIHGLFNQYDFEIDINKPLNVLVGENGTGKSTILKIIKCLYDMDFVNLSRYLFCKIEIINNEDILSFTYDDLFPEPTHLIDGFTNGLLLDILDYKLEQFSSSLFKFSDENSFFYSQFLAKCYFDKPIGKVILSYLPEICYNCNTPNLDYKDEYKKSMELLVQKSTNMKCFKGSKIQNMSEGILYFYEASFLSKHRVIYIDSINNILLYDDDISTPNFTSKKIDMLHLFLCEIIDKERNRIKTDFDNGKRVSFSELVDYINVESRQRAEFMPLIKSLNSEIEVDVIDYDVILKDIASILHNEYKIDINKILTHFYYSYDFINSINKVASTMLLPEYSARQGEDPLDSLFYTKEVLSNIMTYLLPVFPSNSIAGEIIVNIKTYMTHEFHKTKLTEVFRDFYTKYFDSFLNQKSKKIILFENVINSFLNNKHIEVYPNGIKVIIDNYNVKNTGLFELITNETNQIRLMDLSSGERKLILLFTIAIFFEEAVLLIDEPEISLSILWQDMLIDTIIEKTRCKQVVIATHSPFIVTEKIIESSVISLPMEVKK